jgi:hypothetical protein
VAVRVGGNFTLEPALGAINRAREDFANAKSFSAVSPHILLVAGGVGITPLYSMLLHLASTAASPPPPAASTSSSPPAPTPPRITLLWSVRSLHDVFLLPQLRALASASAHTGSALAGRLRLVVTVTRHGDTSHNHGLSFEAERKDVGTGWNDAGQGGGGAGGGGGAVGVGMSHVSLLSGRITPQLLRHLTYRSHAPGSSSSSSSSGGGGGGGGGGSSSSSSSSSGGGGSSTDCSVPWRAGALDDAPCAPGSQHAFICGPPSMTESAPCRAPIFPPFSADASAQVRGRCAEGGVRVPGGGRGRARGAMVVMGSQAVRQFKCKSRVWQH